MANEPNQVKRDIRALERWLDEAGPSWPRDIYDLGRRALLAMKMLDQPDVPDIITREAAKDLANFTAAYAAHVSGSEKTSQEASP